MIQYDTQSLYDFLFHTPEAGLRKMLIDRKNITDVHYSLLLKIVRATNAEQFGELMVKGEFPRVRMSPAETKLKEKFWDSCLASFNELGLLQAASAVAPKMAA